MNNQSAETLNTRLFPLYGVRLIEASAGTGKTYTIANLYLRLLLGHGPDDDKHKSTAHCQTLSVDQILVVTFTEASTGELRDRIRARIHDARLAFIESHSQDSFLQTIMDDLDRHEERIQLLLAAERQMDEAAIFTIHGFCQRMLKQYAFESNTMFSSELLTDESHLLNVSTEDFWRRTLYPMSKSLTALARSLWSTPESLLAAIGSWLNKPDLQIISGKLPNSLDAFHKHYVTPYLAIKTLWLNDREIIQAQLRNCGLKTNCKSLKRLPEMEAFIQSDELIPVLGKDSWNLYSTETLQASLKKHAHLPEHQIFSKIDNLLNNPISLKKAFQSMILKQAFESIKYQLNQLKAMRHQLSFDDLLTNLSVALTGAHGSTLAEAVRSQFRVAMIDEFQDTDSQQYAIFKSIYIESRDNSAGLFMIGDPKQAIYAFRGADIFTYIEARRQVSAHYTLGTNWRSSSAMVETVNSIFSRSSAPFIYRDDIPFHPVSASNSGRQKKLTVNGKCLPAGQIWLPERNDKTIGSGVYQDIMSSATSIEINRLLTLADKKQCLIGTGKTTRPLRADDIAILVRNRKQGQLIRNTLAQQGIASVYLSNSDSVFASQEAKDLRRLLSACLTPTNDFALLSALAAPLFSLSASQLDLLNHDAHAWEQTIEEFSHYQKIWFDQGVLPMLRCIIYQRNIAENLLTSEFGERQLTDLLHLGELLAREEMALNNHHALYRWLSEAVSSPNKNAAEQQLHLESENNLVKIVTIHKSKGLEYNVVFLPFICTYNEAKQPLYHDKTNNKTVLDLEGQKTSLHQAEKERLAEDLRLLYVALTRSVHCCYLGIAPYKRGSKSETTDLHKTAIGYLLNDGNSIEANEISTLLNMLINDCQSFSVSHPPDDELAPYQPLVTDKQELTALSFTGKIERNWWVTSYSALSKSAVAHSYTSLPDQEFETTAPDASIEAPGHDLEVQQESLQVSTEPLPSEDEFSLFCFPKGARPGTFLHTLFERVDFAVSDDDVLNNFVREELLKEGYEEHWQPALCQMLKNCLHTPLDGESLYLGKIPKHQRKIEMEFYIPIIKLSPSKLNNLIASHDQLSKDAGALDFPQIQGMLKGFIDLTFEHQGKWYILDYKSNWLGANKEAYTRDKMAQAMVDHRYDLQYQLYALALHRLLKQRIPDYDYGKHFGGVIYLFLRGITLNDPKRHGIYDHRPTKILIEKLDNLFSGATNNKSSQENKCA
ncbi:MAG: exodeoxyribonuclease V subunit beta [Candidatus Endonucleobacter sp. (ex Gigantidas childressi)]|nr:exodeoxyribonuclease V subunit beta [Candidatus Endonucleobacter sp. (ex Gigantidas childressi)]